MASKRRQNFSFQIGVIVFGEFYGAAHYRLYSARDTFGRLNSMEENCEKCLTYTVVRKLNGCLVGLNVNCWYFFVAFYGM